MLQVQLGGPSSYFGKLVKKPTIGDAVRAICPRDIRRTIHIVSVATIAFLACAISLRFLTVQYCLFPTKRVAAEASHTAAPAAVEAK